MSSVAAELYSLHWMIHGPLSTVSKPVSVPEEPPYQPASTSPYRAVIVSV
jgi:hypothetical protein